MSLRPKYQLNRVAVQGARATIPADQFTGLTTRRYPYPRVGTRAPNGMFPKAGNPHPRYGLGNGGAVLKPKFTLNKTAVQGVMPASTFERISGGELTTQPPIPTYIAEDGRLVASYPPRLVRRALGPTRAPALEIDYGAWFWGAVLGGVLTLGMVYGVIPAIAKAAARRIR